MFKLIGFLMLTVSGTLSGYTVSKIISERVKFIEQYIEFISNTETEIRYICCPASEILKKYSGTDKFNLFLKQCSEYIFNGIPFPDAWQKSLEVSAHSIKLSDEVYRLINGFGKGLGASDIDGQIAHCRYHIQTIKPYLEAELENKRNKSKMYGILGTCLGTIVGLIII